MEIQAMNFQWHISKPSPIYFSNMISMFLPSSPTILPLASYRPSSRLWKQRKWTALCAVLMVVLCAAWNTAAAQNAAVAGSAISAPHRLIKQAVDESQRAVLKGNTHPLARAEYDQGAAPANLTMRRMILVLQRSAEQESALRTLLEGQQTKSSPNYRQWLTPAQFGQQFGPADSDIATVRAWLESHGFQVTSISNGRTAIEFSGTAGQVQEAFHTQIHSYQVNGEQHWANSSDPSIPNALKPAVKGVLTLHNFPRHPQSTVQGVPVRATQDPPAPLPLFTYTSGKDTYYGLGPTDFATIYNVLPLWSAGIEGTGQTIAIVGETNIHLYDIENFRSLFGLPAKAPQIILNGPDPGIVGDEPEALLDVSWSGAVAKNATIDLVVSASTESTLGVDLSALYIVDNNLAPVMSESYGECEAVLGNAGNAFYNALWQQAAAQGITVVISAGDGGSAGCDNFNTESTASDGLAVSGFASTPYNVAVGGTDFDQTAATVSKYWSSTNNATTESSALGYIPETPWNQSCAGLGAGQCAFDSNELNIVAGSGGPSSCSAMDSSGNCLSGYAKPAWQTGTGVPADGVRDIPDVSLFASAGMNGSFYIICEGDMTPFGIISGADILCSLTNQTFLGIGGTSASAPAFAGMMALVNQKTGTRQGNANYVLYNLAAQNNASCDSSTAAATGNSCIYYDITKGSNSVPCSVNSPNCGAAPANGYGILVDANGNPAWTTTAGYDLATGLGTLNAENLVNAWSAATFTPSTTTLTNLSPVNLVHGQAVNVSATVAAKNGSGTPTGLVVLMVAPAGQSQGIQSFPLTNGVASGVTTLLPGGTYNVTAHYAGDANFGASDSTPLQVTVSKENSVSMPTLEAYSSVTGTFSSTNTVPYGSVFFLRGNVANSTGALCGADPTLSGVSCPTGVVSFTLNGNPMDEGSYALNTQGYTEDQMAALKFTSLGNYDIQAQYGGDASYNPSSGAMTVKVTPAPTIMDMLEITDLGRQFNGTGTMNYLAMSGQLFHVMAAARESSIMPAPTGTISFLENGDSASGTIVANPMNGSYGGGFSSFSFGYLNNTLATSIDTPGTYLFTASYPGDVNYTGSQGTYSLSVTVTDTTFNITPPIPNVTITAGQSGTTTVTFAAVDHFGGGVNVTCALPAAMAEATCPAVTTDLTNKSTATAQLTITTTAAHPLTASRNDGKGLYGYGVLACALLLFLPRSLRKRFPPALLILVCIAGFGGCGGGGGSSTKTQPDPGTPAGTYTVHVTATSMNITRTASFNVTVQ